MGGQVYETLTDQAVKRGIFQSVMRLANAGDYTEEEACAVLGAEYPAYLLYKEQFLTEQSTN